jgi:hypothetical protein
MRRFTPWMLLGLVVGCHDGADLAFDLESEEAAELAPETRAAPAGNVQADGQCRLTVDTQTVAIRDRGVVDTDNTSCGFLGDRPFQFQELDVAPEFRVAVMHREAAERMWAEGHDDIELDVDGGWLSLDRAARTLSLVTTEGEDYLIVSGTWRPTAIAFSGDALAVRTLQETWLLSGPFDVPTDLEARCESPDCSE